MQVLLGFDGGGSKTECVALNQASQIVGRARGSASNPTRIGLAAAISAIRQTADDALKAAGSASEEVVAVCGGFAGTGDAGYHARMKRALEELFPQAAVDVRTDLELPLAAMPAGPAIVLVVGTGSAAVGRDAGGRAQREGGYGPGKSDQGSAFDIGSKAIATTRQQDSPEAGDLERKILRHLGCGNWAAVEQRCAVQADQVYPRVFPVVAAAADAGNRLAQELLLSAADELAAISFRLAERLALLGQPFPLGKIGGTIDRSRFFDEALDHALARVLPKAQIGELRLDQAELAAKIAHRLYRDRAHALP
jgi:N-acetylglucosamine kinase-like BadF-type ATPase